MEETSAQNLSNSSNNIKTENSKPHQSSNLPSRRYYIISSEKSSSKKWGVGIVQHFYYPFYYPVQPEDTLGWQPGATLGR
jgi:hypothetical protein